MATRSFSLVKELSVRYSGQNCNAKGGLSRALVRQVVRPKARDLPIVTSFKSRADLADTKQMVGKVSSASE